MLLPKSEVIGFPVSDGTPPADRVRSGDWVSVVGAIDAPMPANAVASRIQMASRHTGAQILEMFQGRAREQLFMREWIIPLAQPAVPAAGSAPQAP